MVLFGKQDQKFPLKEQLNSYSNTIWKNVHSTPGFNVHIQNTSNKKPRRNGITFVGHRQISPGSFAIVQSTLHRHARDEIARSV
jgi:hypothetical protein